MNLEWSGDLGAVQSQHLRGAKFASVDQQHLG